MSVDSCHFFSGWGEVESAEMNAESIHRLTYIEDGFTRSTPEVDQCGREGYQLSIFRRASAEVVQLRKWV